MATYSMTDVTTWVHGHDFSTDLNQIALKTSVDDLDKTTFGNTYKQRTGGLRDVEVSLNGFWQSAASDSVDSEAFPDLGNIDRVLTVSPTSTPGSVAYLAQVGKFKYEAFDQIGAMTPFTLDCLGSNKFGVVRGQVAAAKQNVSATGVIGSALNLGVAAPSQFIYASLHVFGAGTTITVTVQSATDAIFTTPHTVGTIGPVTARGGVWMGRVAGSTADTFYRLNVTAITGAFSVAGAIGVQ